MMYGVRSKEPRNKKRRADHAGVYNFKHQANEYGEKKKVQTMRLDSKKRQNQSKA
jgi:hypothetical protein